jgi:hypothetical protein
MAMMRQLRFRYIGLDVHRATIALAIAEHDGPPSSYGNIANDPSAIRKLMTRLGGPDVRLRVAYEAGRPAMRCTDNSPSSVSNAWWWHPR